MPKTRKSTRVDSEEETSLAYNVPHSGISPHLNVRQPALRSNPLTREASVLSDSGYALGYASDSSNEGGREFRSGAVKYNRAFA
jgi:hypothetical protein